MLNNYFYHGTLKTITYGFGTLFNNIYIHKRDENGNVVSVIKVPIRYGPTQKFLARLKQSPPDLNTPVEITLPRMSFELASLSYDSTRKKTTTTSFLVPDMAGNLIKQSFMPVPYEIGYNLYIMTQLTDDVWQIVEQILPYFTPSHTLTLNVVPDINEYRDVEYNLGAIDLQEDYEGDFSERVTFIYTISFSVQTEFFKPIKSDESISNSIIENVSLGFVADGPGSLIRDLTYTMGPKATESYSNNVIATLSQDISITDNTFEISNTIPISKNDYITIDNETLRIINKINNTIVVSRGEYGTPITDHVLGTEVKLITIYDNSLIPFGDQFGISEVLINPG